MSGIMCQFFSSRFSCLSLCLLLAELFSSAGLHFDRFVRGIRTAKSDNQDSTFGVSRKYYRQFNDNWDENVPNQKSRRRKNIPNLRLHEVVRSIRMRAKKSNSQLLDELHTAYAVASDEFRSSTSSKIEGSEALVESSEDFVPEYASFVRKRRPISLRKSSRSKIRVSTAEELRAAILDNNYELKDVQLVNRPSFSETNAKEEVMNVLSHYVIELIAKRFESRSKPGARHPDDKAKLALAIEGGGMRGAVSAGMAAAIATLGLSDTFDVIYGSSAGSVVGAYMVSRQMCIDVYTTLLTAAKKSFVSKGRIFAHLAKNLARVVLTNKTSEIATAPIQKLTYGMNISYVLEGIMCPQQGLRPLDLDSFKTNDALQPLRVVASSLRQGKMETLCFGSAENDFFDEVGDDGMVQIFATTSADGKRHGLFSCLEASMSVPGAAGPPINLIRSKDSEQGIITSAFDAFSYEPLPYRSAVKEGATHVLVLRSRPEGFNIKTKPGIYERGVAPIYFRAHNQNEVASYFEKGGQLYIYAEDVLTLDEAKNSSKNPVPIPPAKILYGATDAQSGEAHQLSENRDDWDKASMLPIVVSQDTPELKSLEQGEEEVLQAVRSGFEAAFDVLAPAIGLEIEGITGKRVAELVFPMYDALEESRHLPKQIQGEAIDEIESFEAKEEAKRYEKRRKLIKKYLEQQQECIIDTMEASLLEDCTDESVSREANKDAKALLALLPGIQAGRLAPLAEGLIHHKRKI